MKKANLHEICLLQPVRGGTKGARHALLPVVAKRSLEKGEPQEGSGPRPYLVGNEAIAQRLGTLLGLPVLPGGVGNTNEVPHFYCANFRLDRPENEPMTPDKKGPNQSDWAPAINRDPAIAWGIILFDLWILNPDRAPVNLAYDDRSEQFILFDHEACLYSGSKRPSRRLRNQQFGFAASLFPDTHFDSSLHGKVKSPVVRLIDTHEGIMKFYTRVHDLPEWQIREAVFGLGVTGFTEVEGEETVAFLLARREQLLTIILRNREHFETLPGASIQQIEKLAKSENVIDKD